MAAVTSRHLSTSPFGLGRRNIDLARSNEHAKANARMGGARRLVVKRPRKNEEGPPKPPRRRQGPPNALLGAGLAPVPLERGKSSAPSLNKPLRTRSTKHRPSSFERARQGEYPHDRPPAIGCQAVAAGLLRAQRSARVSRPRRNARPEVSRFCGTGVPARATTGDLRSTVSTGSRDPRRA